MPLLYTGARLMEIQTLKWEHVRGDRIHLPDAKTGGRVVPLVSRGSNAVLSAIPRDEDNPWCHSLAASPALTSPRTPLPAHPQALRTWRRKGSTTCAIPLRSRALALGDEPAP